MPLLQTIVEQAAEQRLKAFGCCLPSPPQLIQLWLIPTYPQDNYRPLKSINNDGSVNAAAMLQSNAVTLFKTPVAVLNGTATAALTVEQAQDGRASQVDITIAFDVGPEHVTTRAALSAMRGRRLLAIGLDRNGTYWYFGWEGFFLSAWNGAISNDANGSSFTLRCVSKDRPRPFDDSAIAQASLPGPACSACAPGFAVAHLLSASAMPDRLATADELGFISVTIGGTPVISGAFNVPTGTTYAEAVTAICHALSQDQNYNPNGIIVAFANDPYLPGWRVSLREGFLGSVYSGDFEITLNCTDPTLFDGVQVEPVPFVPCRLIA